MPVPDADWKGLPHNDKQQCAESCAVYDRQADMHHPSDGYKHGVSIIETICWAMRWIAFC